MPMIDVEFELGECEGYLLLEENDRLRELLEQNNIAIPDPPARAYACPALAEMLGLSFTRPGGLF